MAKFSGVAEFKAGTFSYDVGAGKVAVLDVASAFPNAAGLDDHELAAFHFAIKTAARNARASIKPEQVEEAFKAVTDRFAAWQHRVWRAANEATGESRISLLARAVGEALGVDPAEAAEQITAIIDGAVESAGLSYDEDSDKVKIRKIAADCREALKKTVEVGKIYARLQAEEAAKRAEAAQNAPTDGAVSLASLIQR
jgi:ribosomal protein L22